MRFFCEIDASLVVVRERVVLAIERAASGFPVVVVTAPGGFGKSVAVAQAIARRDGPVTWFRQSRGHETVGGFAYGLCRALGAGDEFGPDTSEGDALERIVRATETARRSIVLEDFAQTAFDQRVVTTIARAIEATRDRLTWFVVTRRPDVLPLSHWCATDVLDHPIDETELRFDRCETMQLARAANVPLDERRSALLTERTLGWPAALAAALDVMRESGFDAGFAAARTVTRRLLTTLVAESIADHDREFLMQTAFFDVLTVEILERFGPQAHEAVARIRAAAPLVGTETVEGFRVNALLRERLAAELERNDAGAFARVRAFAAETLAFDAPESPAQLVLRVRETGQGLVERGEIATLRAALATLDADVLARDPALAVLAMQVAQGDAPLRGHVDLAVVESVTPLHERVRVKLGLAARYARDGAFATALQLAGSIDVASLEDRSLRARVLADAAGFAARTGLVVRPGSGLADALASVATVDDALTRALVFRRAADVYVAAGRNDDAERYAGAAIVEARRARAPRIELRARAAAYRLARERGRPEIASALLHALKRLALESDDREMLLFVSCEEAENAALAGDTVRLGKIESEVAALSHSADEPYIEELSGHAHQVLRRSLALASAWKGHFEAALLTSASATAPRSAIAREILYATVTGRLGLVDAATVRMRAAPLAYELSIDALTTRLFLALAAIVRGDAAAAGRELAALEARSDAIPLPYLRFLRAVDVAADYAWNRTPRTRLAEATAAMSEHGLRGYALLIDALPIVARTVLATTLTASELRILECLCEELTSREIADRLGRSVLTIDSHVKAIVKKLKCTGGRRQAVELARSGRIAGLPGRFLFN
jgi:ATP/maltotriose-dependent transcriptional regulator MalT